jgi:hypothetical protein
VEASEKPSPWNQRGDHRIRGGLEWSMKIRLEARVQSQE